MMIRRCSMCIVPETAKGIIFNEDGLCQICSNYARIPVKGHDQLLHEVKEIIDNGLEHNCVVPVSGGRDSAYALYYAKAVLGLRPIAVHNDNDFETAVARQNLVNMSESLGVPLIRTSSSKQVTRKIVAAKLRMNAPYDPGLAVQQICEPCEYGFKSAAYNIARKQGIKLVIWGDSQPESTLDYHRLVPHKIPTKYERLLSPSFLDALMYRLHFARMKKEYGPNVPLGLQEVHLYDYIDWDRRIIVDTIQRELGWTKPGDSSTSWRIDCALVPLVNTMTKRAYGVSKIELGFSNMIRNGKMDRDEALLQVQQIENATDLGSLRELLFRIGLDRAQVNIYLGELVHGRP